MPSYRRLRFLVAVLVVAVCSLVGAHAASAVSSTIVVSQVYGGGGNLGATFKNDFIELYNRSAAPVRRVAVCDALRSRFSSSTSLIFGCVLPSSRKRSSESA